MTMTSSFLISFFLPLFVHGIIIAPSRALRKGLDLDGAHLHPKYVSLIEREMQRILR